MFSDTISSKQLATWVCGAIMPVWIQIAVRAGWLSAVCTAVIAAAVSWAVWRWGKWENKLLLGACVVLEILLLGKLLPYAATIWPGGDQYPAVPLGILALATWSAWKGPRAAAGIGCVLYGAVLTVYLLIIGTGLEAVQSQWLAPTSWRIIPLGLLVGFLPGVASIWKGEERYPLRMVIPPLMMVAASVVVQGVLSPQLLGEGAFLELSKSLSLFGVAKHFEAIASATMTVGWFLIATFILSLCGAQAQRLGVANFRPVVLLCAVVSAAWMLFEMPISGETLLIFGTVCWVLLPLVPQGIEREKKL